MKLFSLLEEMAGRAHHQVDLPQFINNLSPLIKQAFLNKNSAQLKRLLGDTTNLADRDKVAKI